MTDRHDGRSQSGAPEADASGAPAWDGVLFDLDDTSLDLKTAQRAAFTATVCRQWPGVDALGEEPLRAAAVDFAADVRGHYQRYIAGELTFAEQRLARAADALQGLGAPGAAAVPDAQLWVTEYEHLVRSHWRLFPEVAAVLEQVRASGRPVGIVTNNVEEYQRGKAAAIGLGWIDVVVGSDTVGAPKPDAAPFLAGCAGLRTEPARTLFVGDSLKHDVAGASGAGLVPVWSVRDAADTADGSGEGAGTEPVDPSGHEIRRATAAPVREPERGCWRIGSLEALRAWL